jgi:osmotically-inducible protein OsmY
VFKSYLKNDDINVNSVDGAVVLSGTAESGSHKSLAVDTVAALPGVKSVDDKIEVKGEQPSKLSDAWIEAQVKTSLLIHSNVSGFGTDVDVDGGVVTLRGKADSDAEKDLAGQYAKDIDGVKEVRNEMTVVPPKSETDHDDTVVVKTKADNEPSTTEKIGNAIDDASITALAKLELLTHRSTSAIRTTVSTKDGIVTVGGDAKNDAEKELVSKLVGDIHGVRRVDNRMTVQKQ